MTLHQRVLRLEALICAIYNALPSFIKSSLPDLVKKTMETMDGEFEFKSAGIQVHDEEK